jgi:hypothetical protein
MLRRWGSGHAGQSVRASARTCKRRFVDSRRFSSSVKFSLGEVVQHQLFEGRWTSCPALGSGRGCTVCVSAEAQFQPGACILGAVSIGRRSKYRGLVSVTGMLPELLLQGLGSELVSMRTTLATVFSAAAVESRPVAILILPWSHSTSSHPETRPRSPERIVRAAGLSRFEMSPTRTTAPTHCAPSAKDSHPWKCQRHLKVPAPPYCLCSVTASGHARWAATAPQRQDGVASVFIFAQIINSCLKFVESGR